MFKNHIFFIVFALCLCLAHSAHALSIDNLRFGVHSDKTRLVLEISEKADFRAFVLEGPYRLVIDFPQFAWNAGEFNAPASANMADVRSGILKPGVSRLVFDLKGPIAIQSTFLLPAANGKPDRFVLDYAHTSQASFRTEKKKVHGTLNPDKIYNSANTPTPRTAGLAPAPKPPRKTATQKPLVIIDPGHGGIDPGALARNGIKEKDVVLKLSKQLKKRLEATGRYRVEMTREDDRFIKLSNRRKFARERDADLFISVHADSLENKNSSVRGASFYTLSEKASDAQTARLAARENKADLIAGIDLSVEDKDVANILVDLAMRDTMNQAKFFANSLVKTFKNQGVRVLDNAHRYAGFAVLKAPDVPSVLVEAGFLSNRKEADLLNTVSHREKIAKALVSGVDSYFKQVQKNQRI